MDGQTITAIISAVGLSSIVAAIINAWSNRKKTGADATKVITDAALGVVTELRSQIAEANAKQDSSDKRIQELEYQARENLRRLNEHHQWDIELAAFVREHLPAHADKLRQPPPLFDERSKPS